MKDIISQLTLKELEEITFRVLKDTFSRMMPEIRQDFDEAITLAGIKRFHLKD